MPSEDARTAPRQSAILAYCVRQLTRQRDRARSRSRRAVPVMPFRQAAIRPSRVARRRRGDDHRNNRSGRITEVMAQESAEKTLASNFRVSIRGQVIQWPPGSVPDEPLSVRVRFPHGTGASVMLGRSAHGPRSAARRPGQRQLLLAAQPSGGVVSVDAFRLAQIRNTENSSSRPSATGFVKVMAVVSWVCANPAAASWCFKTSRSKP